VSLDRWWQFQGRIGIFRRVVRDWNNENLGLAVMVAGSEDNGTGPILGPFLPTLAMFA
jgi:hypothetical protein